VNSSLTNWWLLAKFSSLRVEIGVPCIERFFLGREIALEIRLTFGNNAPTTGIFVKKDSRYLCAVTIAENDFVRGHEHEPFLLARILARKALIHGDNRKLRRPERKISNLPYCGVRPSGLIMQSVDIHLVI
jgi:hypothetical protein